MGDRYPYDLDREVLDELRGFYVERYVDTWIQKTSITMSLIL